ncbi:LysR family transcriptional regulator [Bordetella sp. BOR01]|uniref:LysR family transcriptional regulator n=1 Tax=Bordetella sp. BOR01 TaxID=2854779 RepID=UPI001C46EFC1|nr:LysR family transcriptional regulator [Bordetella sp. BOR01]MBV7482107.1 LysR family transcriptional regulator [Bordetella sp. BOR01]
MAMTFEFDTKALRCFSAVASHRSFTTAAAHLRISQPAVTRQIQAMERSLGVRLFRREGRHMVLTEAGRVLLEQSRDVLERFDAVLTLVKDAANEPIGKVALGAPTSTGELLLPSILNRFHRNHPKVFVQIATGYSGDSIEMLVDGRLDMALVFGVPSHSDLELHPLLTMDLGLIVPSRSRPDPIGQRTSITLAEAAALPLIFPTRTQYLRKRVEQACQQIGVTPNVVLESDSLGISKELVAAGMGYMFLAASGIRSEIREGRLRYLAVTEPGMDWQLALALRRTKSQPLAVRVLMREIIDSVRAEGAKSGWNWKLA